MAYTDGFVIPVPKRRVAAYRRMARAAGKVWMEYGALEYRECAGDDLKPKGIVASFPKLVRLKPGETVFFSWIVYKSRAHRDRVNARILKDPRIKAMMEGDMPFDGKRMVYGGFEVVVSF